MIELEFSKFFTKRTITIIIASALFYVVFSLISDIQQISNKFASIDIFYIPLILCFHFLAMGIRSIRQKVFFDSLNIKLSIRQNIKLYFVGMSLIVTPGGSGELIKNHILKEKFGHPYTKTIPVLLTEKYHNMLSVIPILFIFLMFRESKEILIITSVIAIILFCIFLIIKNQKLCLNTMSKIPRKWILKEIPDNAASFYDSLLILFKGKTFFFGTSIGILAWLVDAVAIYFCFLAFDLNFDFIYTTLTNFAPMIVGTISFIPGGLGVTELGMTGLLLQSGVVISTASALVLFIRFMITWSTVIAGIIALKLAKFD